MEKGSQSIHKLYRWHKFAELSCSSKRVSTNDCYLPATGTLGFISKAFHDMRFVFPIAP